MYNSTFQCNILICPSFTKIIYITKSIRCTIQIIPERNSLHLSQHTVTRPRYIHKAYIYDHTVCAAYGGDYLNQKNSICGLETPQLRAAAEV